MGVGQRAKNTASAKEVAKLMRGANLVELPAEGDYMEGELDKVIENFEDILRDLLKATPPPTEKLLTDAMNLVFEHAGRAEMKSFALQLVRCVSHIRAKKSTSTGKKTADATYRLLQIVKANKDPENTAQNTPMRRISTTSNISVTSPASSADPIAGTVKRTLQAEKEQELSPRCGRPTALANLSPSSRSRRRRTRRKMSWSLS